MTTVKRFLAALLVIAACRMPAVHAQAAPSSQSPAQTESAKPQEQQNEFVPLDQLPPQEQLPAARLLVIAYAFVMGALFLYVISVARRLGNVRREVERLEADLKRSGRA